MRSFALALPLFLLACPGDDGDGTTDGLDRPRGERCADMLDCAMEHCAAEMQAVLDCVNFNRPDCQNDPAMEVEPYEIAQTACLQDSGCNLTSCAVRADGRAFECEDPSEEELRSLFISGYYSDDTAQMCIALD